MTRPALVTTAAAFWQRAGVDPAQPDAIIEAAHWGVEARVHAQPRLSIATIQRWLDSHRYDVTIDGPDRQLRGCAVATRGQGIIFIDADDSPAERNFTLAHEVGHLVLDYFRPREQTAELIDDPDGSVFDGIRPPSFDQQLSAALRGQRLQPFVHLLARDVNREAAPAVVARERQADELACELLAPMDDVRVRLRAGQDVRAVAGLLHERYRLPMGAADDYARRLVRRFLPAPTFVDWLSG